ncbi:MAG: hypothetical protein JWQ29_62 [Phenylobacterium sp.]|nr:hypothetical protein [Phenylobacterium sp.]
MNDVDEASDGAEAVRRFAARVGAPAPDRIQARLDGEDGMAGLCAVEAALSELWPPATAKELVWLTRTASAGAGFLHLQAYGPLGELRGDATFRLGPRALGRSGPRNDLDLETS